MVKAKQDFMQRYNPRPQQLGGMQQAAFMNNLLSGQQQMPAYGGGYGRFGQQGSQVPILKTLGLDAAFGGDADFGDPRNFHFGATPAPNTQLSGAGALAAGLGQPYVQQSPDVQKLQGGQAPAGGKGGNPTAQLPPPPKQDGTPGSWSTYI